MALNAVTSGIISRMLQRKHILVSGVDIEFLDALGKETEPLEISEIAKKFNLDVKLTESILEELETRGFVESNSSTYSVTQRGRDLIKVVIEVLPTIETKVNQDTYLRLLAGTSSNFVE